MTTIVLTKLQSALLQGSGGPVIVCDESGREIGVIHPNPCDAPFEVELPEKDAEVLARRMSEPNPIWLTTDEVLEEFLGQASG